jgi:hypothetical protein
MTPQGDQGLSGHDILKSIRLRPWQRMIIGVALGILLLVLLVNYVQSSNPCVRSITIYHWTQSGRDYLLLTDEGPMVFRARDANLWSAPVALAPAYGASRQHMAVVTGYSVPILRMHPRVKQLGFETSAW